MDTANLSQQRMECLKLAAIQYPGATFLQLLNIALAMFLFVAENENNADIANKVKATTDALEAQRDAKSTFALPCAAIEAQTACTSDNFSPEVVAVAEQLKQISDLIENITNIGKSKEEINAAVLQFTHDNYTTALNNNDGQVMALAADIMQMLETGQYNGFMATYFPGE